MKIRHANKLFKRAVKIRLTDDATIYKLIRTNSLISLSRYIRLFEKAKLKVFTP